MGANKHEYYNWFSILLQEFSFEADEDILYAIVEFSKFQVAGWDVPALSVDQVFDTTLELPKSTLADDDTRMYFEKFLLQPIKINISFSRTQAVNREEPVIKSGGVLTFMIDVLTTYIANWHDAPWQFNALELSHPIVTPSQLVDLIVRFYTEEAVGQLWRTALGSADFLGNPIGLFNNVSSGVSDMFYEPLQGFEITRPQDLGINFAKGTASLVKKTVYGLSDTVSRVTGSVSKGIARITLDEEFQARRRIHHARNRPKHAVSGISTGALSLASSVVSGVTGVVSKPLEGAEKSGVGGFFMGLGVGLVGVVTKPVVGAFDLLSDVSQGIKNTATSETELERQRLPRLIGKDRILKPYDPRESIGLSWIKELENGRYFKEEYIAHIELRTEDLVSIVTDARVLMVRIKRLKVEWEIPFEDLQLVRVEGNSVSLIKAARQGQASSRIVPCSDPASAQWYCKRIEDAFAVHIDLNRPLD
ncbi:vacuolar protein sorting-associated protein [Polychytrium aggregatum]|uniref:vacuolar protein sorting-associated protein n=1 Tax=Polychytrium aggregatum TaxID=110093 RepID=UPI0022FE80B8|nr:vacuolar protein sorting-associated protein [Polychytrium aggregatum]KAI9208533.1 vacuolar protein sorting-associated protein [Polychytrium aggregatum]